MKYFLTLFMVMLVIVCLGTTATAAGIQKGIDKTKIVDQIVQDDRTQQVEFRPYTVYPLAKAKKAAMHGDYTIGQTGTYLNFFDALVALNTDGMDGDVNLLVKGDYNASIVGETFPITFRAKIPGSGTYKIVVKPNAGETATIATSAYYNYMVNIDSMMNLEFDGNNGTDNFKLSIVANGTRALTGRTVSVYNGSQFINFKNLTFASASGGSSVYRNVDVSGTNRVGGAVKDVEFLNCRFYDNGVGGAEQALYISGYAAINELSARINVRNCVFKNWNGLGTYTGAAIILRYGVTDCIFENNEFYHENPAIIEGGLRAISIGGTSDKMQNITMRNNNIHDLVSNVAATTCYAIQVSGPTTTANLYAPINIVVDGNTINNIKAPHAASISAVGIIFGNSGQNVTISNNVITNIGGGGVQPQGIRVGYATTTIYSVDNCSIVGNTIDGIVGGHTAASWVAGIQTGYVTNLVISKNKVTNLSSTTIGKNVAGITLWGASGMTQSATVANNFVYLPTASATVSDGLVAGIFDYGYVTNAADIYYNSTYIGGTNFGATEFSVAYYRSNGNITNVKNNIFYNDRAGAGLNVAVEDDSADFTAYASDYNDIYSTSGVTGVVSTALATTLGDWTTLTGGLDVNSKSVAPTYVSNTDLHMKTGTATTLENAGTPVSVTTDIDGQTRPDGSAPDIGADEFTTGTPGTFTNLAPVNNAINIPINGSLTWNASQYAYSYDIYLDKVDGSTLVGNILAPTTSYPYSGLDGNTPYFWKVIAKNDIGTTQGTLKAGAVYTFTTAALPPDAPSDVNFASVTNNSLIVNWTDNSSTETGFHIYKSTDDVTYTLEGSVLADVKTFPVASLSGNTRYYFHVTAYQTVQGESEPAVGNVATLANVPTAPSLLLATKRSMAVKPGLGDGNSSATTYAFLDEVSGKYVQEALVAGSPVTLNPALPYYVLGATPVFRTRTAWGPISGTTIIDLFPSTTYTFKAIAKNLDGIETAAGPTSTLATQAPLSVFPVTEGFDGVAFPPQDWGRLDVAGDGTQDGAGTYYGIWGKASTTVYKGTGCARYLWEETGVNGADDWLFNQPMTLTAGTNYIVSFYVRTSGADEKMEVTIGDAPTAAAQTTILAEYNPLYSTSYIFKGIVFTVPSTGTYYIAFHASTPENMLWIRMDEVKVAEANPTDIAFLTLTQTTGTRPMTKANLKAKSEEIVAVPFDRSKLNITNGKAPSDISSTLLVTEPVNTSYKLVGFAGEQEAADAFNNNNGILKATPSTVNIAGSLANIGVNTIPAYTVNYTVDNIAQPPFIGGAILPGTAGTANLGYVPPSRGMFDAVAAAVVAGEGDPTNDTARVALMVYPTPSYNLRYDTYGPNTYVWGVSDPYPDAKTAIGIRYTNTVRGRVAQVDLLTNSNRRSGSTYLNVIVPEVWTIKVRAAGPDDNTPGPVLYTKQFTGSKYNTLSSTVKTLALGDDAPVIEAGQNFWVTATAESIAATTGGYPFGLYDGITDAASLLPGAAGRSYASDYVVESWYAMDAAVLGAGDYGHWPMRAIMVPVSNSISGVVFEDVNGNGIKDVGESGLENWAVKLSGGLDITVLTNASGVYSFNGIENGTFTLTETVQSGWACTVPGSGASYSVTLAGSESVVRDFANFKSTSVSGKVWFDTNHDGLNDPSEDGIDGVTLTLTTGSVPTTVTTAGGGLYSFSNVYGGSYTLAASGGPLAGLYETYPGAPVAFDVTSGLAAIERNFGFSSSDDTLKYRSIVQTDLVTLNSKGKVPTAVKRKADKVEFELALTGLKSFNGHRVNQIHMEWGAALFATTDIKYPGQTFPVPIVKKNGIALVSGVGYNLTGVIDGKNKKFEYVFTDSLEATDVISFHAYAKATKPIKAKYWVLPIIDYLVGTKVTHEKFTKVALLGTEPGWILNQPRLPMPVWANLIEETYKDAGYYAKGMTVTDSLVIGIVRVDSPKAYGWVWLPKPGDVQKSLYDKVGGTHDGVARYFDLLGTKPFVKQQKSLLPKVHDNQLFAEILALKLAIKASATQHMPLGFGELVYFDSTTAYASFHGKYVKEIAAEASKAMTRKTSAWGTPADFNYVIHRINAAFTGVIDTVSFSNATVLKGVNQLKAIPFLISDPGVVKATITPSFAYDEVPTIFDLAQNYPNPFNPTTTIEFILPEDALVTMTVYNVLGQEVATLANKELYSEGRNDITFDASRLASGVYFYRLSADGVGENAVKFSQVKKMLLMK